MRLGYSVFVKSSQGMLIVEPNRTSAQETPMSSFTDARKYIVQLGMTLEWAPGIMPSADASAAIEIGALCKRKLRFEASSKVVLAASNAVFDLHSMRVERIVLLVFGAMAADK
ncbi:unnamed protein product [Lepeophtheirus salmonis]|uniref:(salmon louse) hypothetical protein n=1 Tax=Lepeophtheirus salmonis TaxID=72036 RepID=A0A7R8CX16_LEPSM|nr:unnamed protein product [Lepeophtheirus salmonis]CAF2957421.1 unnamed protein product [Lepeophtheirus salmonis]